MVNTWCQSSLRCSVLPLEGRKLFWFVRCGKSCVKGNEKLAAFNPEDAVVRRLAAKSSPQTHQKCDSMCATAWRPKGM